MQVFNAVNKSLFANLHRKIYNVKLLKKHYIKAVKMKKSHLYFKNEVEGIKSYKGRPGAPINERDNENPNYVFMAESFRNSINNFLRDIKLRHRKRDIKISKHFDLIEITFQGNFDQNKYQVHYLDSFGLLPMRFTLLNTKGLFVVENEDKFKKFISQLENFISKHVDKTDHDYDHKIRFIKSFKLFSSKEIIRNINNYDVINLSFLNQDTFAGDTLIKPQIQEFEEFLAQNKIDYTIDYTRAEIYNVSKIIVERIINNFDFIYASCSSTGAIVKPTKYGTSKREYGFEIINSDEDLPVIGIIDSGISDETPLSSIIVKPEQEYNLTPTSSYRDNADHGTGVAAFAALGTKLIPGYTGKVDADAKLLSIKIIDAKQGAISQFKVIELIRRAHIEYGVRIFVLTVGYTDFPLKDNEEYSVYARMLDELSFDLDILIFISTTNHCVSINKVEEYPVELTKESANIAPPGESINNVTVGACADNYEDDITNGLADDKYYPAVYTRRFHYNYSDKEVFSTNKSNKCLVKPDILIGGGDYSMHEISGLSFCINEGSACLEVLSSQLEHRTYRSSGTSYSAPLAANMAVRLMKLYPNENMQTIKALLINSSKLPMIDKQLNTKLSSIEEFRLIGNGIPCEEKLYYSSDDIVTLVLKDEIEPGNIKSYPLHIPNHLRESSRKTSLLDITSTLVFKVKPNKDNQLLYCPIHISYCIGKNLKLEETEREEKSDKETGEIKYIKVNKGYNGNKTSEIKLSSSSKGWVQDYYYKNKLCSNVQKSHLGIKKDILEEEDYTLKLVVNSALHKQLPKAEKELLENKPVPFSLVVTIEQTGNKGEDLDSLYNGLEAENTLEAISQIDIDIDINN